MAADDNPKTPKKKRRRLLGLAFSLVSLAILSYIAIALISGSGLSLSGLSGIFGKKATVEPVNEFRFSVGRNRVFADLGGYIASAGTLGIQVQNAGGVETLRDSLRLSTPAISATDGRAIAFDIGGTSVRAFNQTQIYASIETNGEIVSASINRNGWFVVCTQDAGAYKSIVTAYDSAGSSDYRVSLSSGYALRAIVSPDNRKLAILSLTDYGSRVTLYDLYREDPDWEYNYPGGLIIDMRFLPNGGLLAVTTDELIAIDREGVGTEFFGYDGRRLGGYILDDGFTALHLFDYGVGYRGRIVTLDDDGRLLGGVVTDREIISMSHSRGYFTVLKSDGPVFFDSELNEYLQPEDLASAAGATKVISLGDGAALVAGDHIALLLRIGEDTGH